MVLQLLPLVNESASCQGSAVIVSNGLLPGLNRAMCGSIQHTHTACPRLRLSSVGQRAEGHRQLLDMLQMPVSPLRARSDFAIQDTVHQVPGREIGRGNMESITP